VVPFRMRETVLGETSAALATSITVTGALLMWNLLPWWSAGGDQPVVIGLCCAWCLLLMMKV
jgi:hypothetical protein